MKPGCIERCGGVKSVNAIAQRHGSNCVCTCCDGFGVTVLRPGEFERLVAEGVSVMSYPEMQGTYLREIKDLAIDTKDAEDPRQMNIFDFLS